MSWWLVGCGGAIGAMLRYSISLQFPLVIGQFPWATWWANILGCTLAGLFLAASEKFALLQGDGRLFLLVGVLGGFTTFSSFGLESFNLLRYGHIQLALLYSLSSMVLGFSMLAVFYYLFRQLLA